MRIKMLRVMVTSRIEPLLSVSFGKVYKHLSPDWMRLADSNSSNVDIEYPESRRIAHSCWTKPTVQEKR